MRRPLDNPGAVDAAGKSVAGEQRGLDSFNWFFAWHCGNCVGKRFAPEGSMPQPQSGVVRQEDLPKLLRIVKASDGIEGAEPDPDRLTLILDDDNTILQAFWE